MFHPARKLAKLGRKQFKRFRKSLKLSRNIMTFFCNHIEAVKTAKRHHQMRPAVWKNVQTN